MPRRGGRRPWPSENDGPRSCRHSESKVTSLYKHSTSRALIRRRACETRCILQNTLPFEVHGHAGKSRREPHVSSAARGGGARD